MLVNARIVLCLNSAWQRIGYKSVKQAIKDMTAGGHGEPVALALDIVYPLKEDGNPDFSQTISMNPTKWEDWIVLPVRSFDLFLNTPRIQVRVPTVIISPNFHKMPKRLTKPTKQNIWERDKRRCQYSGKLLTRKEATLDHVIPKSRGGRNTWKNLVLADKKINLMKKNRLNEEIGLQLIKEPSSPLPIPLSFLIKEVRHRDHKFFIEER